MGKLTTQHAGFTLFELIMVIVVLGILAITANSRFSDSGSFSSLVAQDQLIATARFAQQTAMTRGPNVNVSLSISGSNYQVLIDGVAIFLPGGGTTASLPDGASVTPNPVTVSYDSLGNSTGGQTTLTIAVAGEANRTVTIEASGYAH